MNQEDGVNKERVWKPDRKEEGLVSATVGGSMVEGRGRRGDKVARVVFNSSRQRQYERHDWPKRVKFEGGS